MRLVSALDQVTPAAAPGVTPPDGPQSDGPLLGSWSATRWQYTSDSDQGRTQDVVVDLRGTVTLSLGNGTWILSWDLPGEGNRTVGGRYRHSGDVLELERHGADGAERVRYRLGADTLALSAEDSSWDFGTGAIEPATFVAVFVRL